MKTIVFLYSILKKYLKGISEKRINDLNLFLKLIKENIYLIEKKWIIYLKKQF